MQNFQEVALYARKAVMWQIVIFFQSKLAIETVSVLTPTLEKLKGVFPKLNSIQMLHFLSKNKNNGLYGWMHM